MKTVIEVDEFKKVLKGYDPNNSEDFHVASAKLADKEFLRQLKLSKFEKVIFMAGGVASGKSEFASSYYLDSENILIYDGTLKNTEGFKIKYKKIKNIQPEAEIEIVYILPKSIREAYIAFCNRERKMTRSTFIETHINSKLSFAQLAKFYPEVNCKVYINDLTSKNSYERLVSSRDKIINYIEDAVTELKLVLQDIINNIELDQEKDN